MNMEEQRKRARRRRKSLPEPIGQIIQRDFPELVSPDINITYDRNRKILSVRSEEGLPMEQMDGLFNLVTNSRIKNKKEALSNG